MQIEDVRSEKRNLEKAILEQIRAFEKKTGATIESIELYKFQTVSTVIGVSEVNIHCYI